MKGKILFQMYFICCLAASGQTVDPPEWYMLPFPIGKTYSCTQGNYDDPLARASKDDQIGLNNATHNASPKFKTMMYAFDFALAWGDQIVSPAPCTVVRVKNIPGTTSVDNYGFGNIVVVAYNDGTYGRFCHMANQIKDGVDYLTRVKEGQSLSRGQLIGFCGNTGYCIKSATGDGSHLHYRYQQSFPKK
ncbi:MAG: M23 family metallopeptidase [Patescibacteria group bacterium]|nr:M23 family metallopeptidase [Patescibacteria group bacterium]